MSVPRSSNLAGEVAHVLDRLPKKSLSVADPTAWFTVAYRARWLSVRPPGSAIRQWPRLRNPHCRTMIYCRRVSFGRIENEYPEIGGHPDGNVGACVVNGGVGSASHWRRVVAAAAGIVALDGNGPHGTREFRSLKVAGRQLFRAGGLG